jgi:hypothetical protein
MGYPMTAAHEWITLMAPNDSVFAQLVARVDAIEKQQDRMEDRQQRILDAVTAIQSQMDKATGGATAIRWLLGFLGLGTVAGCIAFFATVRQVFEGRG